MKKWIIISIVLVIILALILSFILCDKSKMIADAYTARGLTVSIETLENDWVHAFLDDLPPEQLEKVSDYKILYAYVPEGENIIYRAVIVVCPSIFEAKRFLKDCGNGLYEEKKNSGMIQGNCILFALNYGIKEIFNDYLFIYIYDKIIGY